MSVQFSSVTAPCTRFITQKPTTNPQRLDMPRCRTSE